MAKRRSLKAKDIERLENTSMGLPPFFTTATTFCCPTERGVCEPTFFC